MSVDTIANMLSTIKNASMAGRFSVEVPFSGECENIAKILKEKGFLEVVKVFKESGKSYKKIHLDIAKDGGISKITEIERISKPGRRVYRKVGEIKPIAGGYGILILSTPRGIMDGREAIKRKLGGEAICLVY